MAGALLAVGTGGLAAVDFGVAATNSTEFCVSCHSMQNNFEEYKQSIHYRNASGVRAGCSDCHVPRALGAKLAAKITAAKDVWHEFKGTIDTPEKFEARRWTLANRVWTKMKATDSRECRGCHDFTSMDLDVQDSMAAKKHAKAPLRGKTCIDCHTGIAHHEPEPPEDMAAAPEEI
jgi:cytochrome c-type protein NapC